MNPKLRSDFFNVIDGAMELLPLMYMIANYKNPSAILEWLNKNNLKGKDLSAWYDGNFKGSALSFIKWVDMKIRKEKHYAPLIAGKDMFL